MPMERQNAYTCEAALVGGRQVPVCASLCQLWSAKLDQAQYSTSTWNQGEISLNQNHESARFLKDFVRLDITGKHEY